MRHGGDRIRLAARANCAPEEILDFSVNLNPCGAPEYVAEACCRALDRLAEYPSPYSERLCGIAAETFGVACPVREWIEPAACADSVCLETAPCTDRGSVLSGVPDGL